MPTYFEQREKIIQAYLSEDIQPFEPKFCFCGTLCNHTANWFYGQSEVPENFQPRHMRYSSFGYAGIELYAMEEALLKTIHSELGSTELIYSSEDHYGDDLESKDGFEDALFLGMCAALDVLKEIHRSRGEDVDTEPATPFIQRNLQEVCNG